VGGEKPLIIVKYKQGLVTRLLRHSGKKDKIQMDKEKKATEKKEGQTVEEPEVIEEIIVEELSIDGVCGVY